MALFACLLLWGSGAARSAPGAGAEQNRAAKDAGAPPASKGPARDAGAVAVAPDKGQAGQKEAACPAGMSYLPAATFTMGSNDKKNKKYWLELEDGPDWPWLDEPIRKVSISALCMDTTEVTVAAYRACVKAGKCATIADDACIYRNPKLDDHPMDCVTWPQADQFCRTVGKRLPTEEEWEYGARGTDRRRYPWGNADPHYDPHSYGYREFCQITPGKTPCPVDQFRKFPSPFGLLNMTGNLSEWTSSEDCELKGPCRRIVRGSGSPALGELRSAHRDSKAPSGASSTVGFRCARSPEPPL
jgi:formylglycine-generating enzyme